MKEVTKEPRRIHVSHGPQEQRIGLEADFPRCLGSEVSDSEGGGAAGTGWMYSRHPRVRQTSSTRHSFFFLVFSLVVSSFQIRFKILPVCLGRPESEGRGVPPHSQLLCLSRLPACSLGCFGRHAPFIRFADEVLGEVSQAMHGVAQMDGVPSLFPLLAASSACYLVHTRRVRLLPEPAKTTASVQLPQLLDFHSLAAGELSGSLCSRLGSYLATLLPRRPAGTVQALQLETHLRALAGHRP